MGRLKERAETLFVPIREEHIKTVTFLWLGGGAMHGLQNRVNIKLKHWIVVFCLGIVGNLSLQLETWSCVAAMEAAVVTVLELQGIANICCFWSVKVTVCDPEN